MKSFKTLQNKAKNSIFAKTAVMLFLMAFTASTAWALDYTASGQTISDATTWTGTANINGNGTITFSQRITISGSVILNLGAGTTLVASKGIELAEGNKLTIYGSGTLTATGASGKSGIGSRYFGTLVVNGGNITATGGTGAAGIGGDQFSWTMGHIGDGTTVSGNKTGTISGTPWSWVVYNNASMTYYNNGTFQGEWTQIGDNLFRMGYNYGSNNGVIYKTKSYAVDYQYSTIGSANYGFIGIEGWTEIPTHFYIVDDWFYKESEAYLGTKIDEIIVDGATYSIYAAYEYGYTPNQSQSNHLRIISHRETPRQQGHIDISAHLKRYKELFYGQTMTLKGEDVVVNIGNKIVELMLCYEAGLINTSSTGSVDYTYFRMTDEENYIITINGGMITAIGGTNASGIGAASNGGSPGMLALGDGITAYGGTSSNPTGNAVTGPVNDVTTRYRYMKVEKSSGISTAINNMTPSTDEPIYFNLQGQRVDHPTWGIYIRQQGKDRKKVVVRD